MQDITQPARHARQLLPEFIAAGLARGQSHGTITCSVLQADVVGFTALTKRLAADGERGRETLGDVLARTHQAVGRAVAKMGGGAASISGDGVVVLFPGDTGLRATAAAEAIRRALARGDAGMPVEMRIGLAKGEVTWSVYRSKARAAYGLEGRPILRASLAEQAARTGDIVADAGLAAGLPLAFGPPNPAGLSILRKPPVAPESIPQRPRLPGSDPLSAALMPVDISAQ